MLCELVAISPAWAKEMRLLARGWLVGFASMVLFGLLYRAFPVLAESKLAGIHFVLFNLGAIVFLAGIPLAQVGQTVALVASGSLLVLVAILTFLANYFLNVFSALEAVSQNRRP